MAPWLPPFLAGSITIVLLWIALGIQRFVACHPPWAIRLARQLRRWDGRISE